MRSLKQPRRGRSSSACATASSIPTSLSSTTPLFERSTRWRIIGSGARRTSPIGWAMAAFEYRQAQEIRDAFKRHQVRYLFIGKSGAILLGFPDTTQDVDLFVAKSTENGRALAAALSELGFPLTPTQVADIERGKDFVQLR